MARTRSCAACPTRSRAPWPMCVPPGLSWCRFTSDGSGVGTGFSGILSSGYPWTGDGNAFFIAGRVCLLRLCCVNLNPGRSESMSLAPQSPCFHHKLGRFERDRHRDWLEHLVHLLPCVMPAADIHDPHRSHLLLVHPLPGGADSVPEWTADRQGLRLRHHRRPSGLGVCPLRLRPAPGRKPMYA